MKKILFTLCAGTLSAAAFAQDSMQTARSSNMNMSDRIAARDMTGAMTPPALPMMHTFVPPEVMTQANSKYGKNLYAVTMLKVGAGTDAYQVMVMENQTPRFEWIGADGSVITDIYRVDTGAMATGVPSNTVPTGTTNPMNNTNPNNANNANAMRDSANRMNNNMNVARDSANMMNNNMNRTDTSMRRDTSNMMNNPGMRTDTTQNRRRDSLGNMNNNPGTMRDTGNRRGTDTARRGDSGSSMRLIRGTREIILAQKQYAPFHNRIRNSAGTRKNEELYRREELFNS